MNHHINNHKFNLYHLFHSSHHRHLANYQSISNIPTLNSDYNAILVTMSCRLPATCRSYDRNPHSLVLGEFTPGLSYRIIATMLAISSLHHHRPRITILYISNSGDSKLIMVSYGLKLYPCCMCYLRPREKWQTRSYP